LRALTGHNPNEGDVMTKFKPVMLAAALSLLAAPVLACEGANREAMEAARTAAFAEADANGDGALTPEEFETFHAAMKARKAQLRFAKLDADGNGQLTAAELESHRGHRGKRGPRHGD